MKTQLLSTLISLVLLTECLPPAYLRRTRQRTSQAPSFPAELREEDLAAWKIPNKVFCAEMERSLDSRHLVLPWWHHYCQDLKDRHAKLPTPKYFYLPIHQAILQQAQQFRREGFKLGRINLRTWTRRI